MKKYIISCFTKLSLINQVVWAPVARSSSQVRTRGILGSIPRGNNGWPVCMSLRMSRISRPPLVGRKPVRKPKKMSLINDMRKINERLKYERIINTPSVSKCKKKKLISLSQNASKKRQTFILFNLFIFKNPSFPRKTFFFKERKTFVYSHEIKCKLDLILFLFHFLHNQ